MVSIPSTGAFWFLQSNFSGWVERSDYVSIPSTGAFWFLQSLSHFLRLVLGCFNPLNRGFLILTSTTEPKSAMWLKFQSPQQGLFDSYLVQQYSIQRAYYLFQSPQQGLFDSYPYTPSATPQALCVSIPSTGAFWFLLGCIPWLMIWTFFRFNPLNRGFFILTHCNLDSTFQCSEFQSPQQGLFDS